MMIKLNTVPQRYGKQTIPGMDLQEDVQTTIDGGIAKPQGPSDTDLDYASWGKCTELKPHSNLQALFDIVRPSSLHKRTKAHHVRVHGSSPSPAQLLFAAILMQPEKAVQP